MRWFACYTFAAFISVGCARQSGPDFPAPARIEKSVFPLYVLDEQTTKVSGLKHQRTLANHRGCSAVYVAPHLLVTSATVFSPAVRENITTINIANVMVADGDHFLNVEDVPYLDMETGLALIQTSESGVPISLQTQLFLQEPVFFLGFAFEPVNDFGRLALVHWKSGPVRPINEVSAAMLELPYFMAEAEIFLGMCGSVVFDKDKLVAGIIHRRYLDRVSVINASTICKALKEVENDQDVQSCRVMVDPSNSLVR